MRTRGGTLLKVSPTGRVHSPDSAGVHVLMYEIHVLSFVLNNLIYFFLLHNNIVSNKDLFRQIWLDCMMC